MGQSSRDNHESTGNIVHKTQNKEKQNKIQKTEEMSNTYPTKILEVRIVVKPRYRTRT